MQHVLIGTCGWVACMDAQLNVQADMEALLGPYLGVASKR